ncbi:RETR3 regulator, partial [Bucco capensis]|nr:RETR3 regulator [Bucco capensis]
AREAAGPGGAAERSRCRRARRTPRGKGSRFCEAKLGSGAAVVLGKAPADTGAWSSLTAVAWFFALTSLRLLFLVAFTLIIVVCLDQWKNKIWPEVGVARPGELDNESWGYVHPQLLGVPELCHHLAEAWVAGTDFFSNLFIFKRQNPGKFCLLACGVFTFLAVLGRYIPGLLLSYLLLLLLLLWPLAVSQRLGQRLYLRLEPVLQRLDFSGRGYGVSRQRQLRRRSLNQEAVDDGSDSEEELAAFCPKLDDSVVAKELTISDSEHSDAEVSYTENGIFNLSRGQTPLTEGSEDLDGHSDPEESFARDLPDFPSINPEATGLDDEDDTSIGIPSLAYRCQATEELHLPYEQEESSTLPSVQNLTNNIAGFVTRGMIQLALSGAPQAGSSHSDNPQRRARLRTGSSDLDTDAEGDDFELLDQSELNQLDPAGSRGQ